MSATEWIGLISTTVSTAVALVSLAFASKANREAKKSNAIAEEANNYAKEANRLAKDANETSRRALAVTEDDTAYNWEVQFDRKTELVTITNDCAWPVKSLEIVARFQDQTVGESSSSNVAAFGEVSFSLTPIVIEHLKKKKEASAIVTLSGKRSQLAYMQADVTFYLSWCTETGVPRHDEITKTIG